MTGPINPFDYWSVDIDLDPSTTYYVFDIRINLQWRFENRQYIRVIYDSETSLAVF